MAEWRRDRGPRAAPNVRFLIDECLSPALVGVAHEEGYEAYHVAHRGWSGLSDPRLFRILLQEQFVLVTNNREDFLALIGRTELHPGLVVIVENVPRAREIVFFRRALAHIAAAGSDMINRVVEVDGDGVVRSYSLPGLE